MNNAVIGIATNVAAAQKVVKYCWICSRSSHLYIPRDTVYMPTSGTPDMMNDTKMKSHHGAMNEMRIV